MINKNIKTQNLLKKKYFKNKGYILKGIYFDENKHRYIKINRPERLKYIKRNASKKFRRYKNIDLEFSNSSFYKKIYSVFYECW